MRVPQVKERVKESPASALRAMFAGIGSMLFVKDKIRHKAGTENSAPETDVAAPETTITPETAVAETAAPETVVAEAAVAQTTAVPAATPAPEDAAAPETVAAQTTAEPETAAAAALPLPNYDELTIASLRARLRTLTPDQLTVLIDYEKAHANRADVITMFERRITKLALGLTQSLPKVTE
jgi:hypothetical protein